MRRRVAALALLAVLAALAGCGSVFGPGDPDPERLNQNATYEWDDEANVSILVNRSSYEAVYDVGNRSQLELYQRDALGRDTNLRVAAVKYRFVNGTTITAADDALAVDLTRTRTVLDLPNESNGSVAFTATRRGKRFATPVFVEGSYAVTLPPNARVGVPLLSQVSPGGFSKNVSGERTTLRWADVTSRQISIRYYLQRDLLLFAALVIGAVVLGVGGALYYYRQIKALERRREQAGIDVDYDDDDDPRDEGPPPGMR